MPNQSERPIQGGVEGTLIRGGTSRGLFCREDELPPAGPTRDALLVELFGSPDSIQVDGIGGGESHTSKAMIVEPTDRDGADIAYTFGQVEVEEPTVAWGANCGNLTAAIGVYALREGMVRPREPTTDLTLYNTNTGTTVEQTVPVRKGEPDVYGEYAVDGVPGTGARVDSTFVDPAGSDGALPTGRAKESLDVDGEAYPVSLVDVTNPNVFVRAADLGLSGVELPAAIEADADLMARIERVRGAAAARLGVVDDPADAATESPEVPFLQIVSPPQSYGCSTEGRVESADVDVTGRIMSNGHPHHAYAMTGAMCLGAAAHLDGTIPDEVADPVDGEVRIGHPKGRITVGTDVDGGHVAGVTMRRTARPLFHGAVYYRYVADLAALR
ncbi:MAG: 2-methylaconitate cis-trans isomerase PrpF family protein [Haloferacaceae archaeon]